jgi:hypothetical protein
VRKQNYLLTLQMASFILMALIESFLEVQAGVVFFNIFVPLLLFSKEDSVK